MNTQEFNEWMARMGFDKHGGQKQAAEALGLSVAMVRILVAGKRPDGKAAGYSRQLDLACAALAFGLKPWSARSAQ